jgi:hypothetical protein
VTVTAVLAMAILLFGEFGQTEGRILATTALLALFGLLELPAGILLDQERQQGLAVGDVLLAAAGFALAAAAVWSGGSSDTLGKLTATVVAFAVAAAQTGALAARLSGADPPAIRRLFAASTTLAAVLASALAVAAWAEIDSELLARIFAAAVVLDVLLVALQPVLGVLRRGERSYVLRLRLEPPEELELTVEASRPALAAARAIDTIERTGRRVVALKLVEAASEPQPTAPDAVPVRAAR